MSIRNLDILFQPRSIALVGASRQPRSVGAVLARNLLAEVRSAGDAGQPARGRDRGRPQLSLDRGVAAGARSRRDRDAACERAADRG
jgi:hypothetical protein